MLSLTVNGCDYLTLSSSDKAPISIALSRDTIESDELESSTLKHIFTKLQPIINPRKMSSTATKESFSLDEIEEDSHDEKIQSIIGKDTSILNQCMHQLAIGDFDIQGRRKDSVASQIFISTENIRMEIDPRGSLLWRLTTNAMTVLGAESQKKMMRRLGFCYSRQTEDRNDQRRTDKMTMNFKRFKSVSILILYCAMII